MNIVLIAEDDCGRIRAEMVLLRTSRTNPALDNKRETIYRVVSSDRCDLGDMTAFYNIPIGTSWGLADPALKWRRAGKLRGQVVAPYP